MAHLLNIVNARMVWRLELSPLLRVTSKNQFPGLWLTSRLLCFFPRFDHNTLLCLENTDLIHKKEKSTLFIHECKTDSILDMEPWDF